MRLLLAAVPIPFTCLALARLASCTGVASCAGSATWGLLATAVVGALVATISLSVVRTVWLLAATARAAGRLQCAPVPDDAACAAAQAGIGNLRHVAGEQPVAFCAGGLRPRVYITTALTATSDPDELLGILAHELHHARHRHPLQRALRRALTDIHFFLPAARWWAEWRSEQEELAADAAALRRVGPAVLARALLRVAPSPHLPAAAAFDHSAEARVAQLLGEPPVLRRCPWEIWVATTAGGLATVAAALCVTQIAIG